MDDLAKIEITDEVKVLLREEQGRLVKIIEAFVKLENSKEWEVLKDLVFNKSLASVERQLLNETLALNIDTNKLYKLQGEWVWAKQYSESGRFVEMLKKQLEDIKNKLK